MSTYVYFNKYSIAINLTYEQTVLRCIQPFVLARFMRCLLPCSTKSLKEVICWAALNSVFPWFMFTIRHMGLTRGFLAGMHLRCAYHGLIFRKVRLINNVRLHIYLIFQSDYSIINGIIRSALQWKNYQYNDK